MATARRYTFRGPPKSASRLVLAKVAALAQAERLNLPHSPAYGISAPHARRPASTGLLGGQLP